MSTHNENDKTKNLNEKNKDFELNVQNALNGIVSFFPEYQDLMYKLFTSRDNMTNEINKLKKTIFDEILITYHEEVMENILYIIENIQQKHTLKYLLAIPDFIDLLYNNDFYDVFAMKFQELEIIDPDKITVKHLNIFNLMVYAEHIKYNLYVQLESKLPDNEVIKNNLITRKANSILRINVCVNLLENYPRISNKEYDYLHIIEKNSIFVRNMEFTNKFFKEIN
jgi:hypothetical protein